MVTDVHAHCIPEEFRNWLETSGSRFGAVPTATARGIGVRFADKVTTGALRDDLTDVEARLAAMDRQGVDVQVLAGWIDLTAYELDPVAGAEYSRVHNDALAGEAAKAPGRFRSIGTAPLQDADRAVAELERCMGDLEMVGVEIATTVDGVWLDQANLDPFWAAAESLGAFILLHPMRPLSGVDMNRYFMDNMIARPAESTISLAGLIFAGIFERYPGLRVCIVHGGGFAPFQIGRMDRGYVAKPGLTSQHISRTPREFLQGLYVDTVVHDPGVLRYLVELMGAEHILLGTDYPFEMGDDDPVGFIKSAGLSPGQETAILSGNAAVLFG